MYNPINAFGGMHDAAPRPDPGKLSRCCVVLQRDETRDNTSVCETLADLNAGTRQSTSDLNADRFASVFERQPCVRRLVVQPEVGTRIIRIARRKETLNRHDLVTQLLPWLPA